MDTAAIYIKTEAEVKIKATRVAKELGFSLSSLINTWLKQLIKTKNVSFSANAKPSPYLIESLKKSEEDIKAGRVLSFDTGEKAVKYFQSLEENE